MNSRASTEPIQPLLKALCDGLSLWFLVILFGVMCLTFSATAMLCHGLLSRRWGTAVGRSGIMTGFRVYTWALAATGAYRLDLQVIDTLRGGPPIILAPNHPSLIDALLILSRHPDVACVFKGELLSNPFLGAGARLARYIRSDLPRRMIKEAIAELQRGGALLLFPEGTRSTRDPINPLTASIGVIAKRANVPVQVLIIETDSPYLGKGWRLFRRPVLPITYRLRLGKRFDPPTDPATFMVALEREYAQQLEGALQSQWLGEVSAPRVDSYSQ